MSLYHLENGTASELRRIDAELEALGNRRLGWLDPESRYRLRLGLHELLVNIYTHAYGPQGGPIDVMFGSSDEEFHVFVMDAGRSFHGSTSRSLPLQPSAGGYGLAIIGEVFSDVRYRRVDQRNIWELACLRRPPDSRT